MVANNTDSKTLMQTREGRESVYKGIELTRKDLHGISKIDGVQKLLIKDYPYPPNISELAAKIAREGKQNFYKSGMGHIVFAEPETIEQFPNFVCTLARIVKAEEGGVRSKELKVVPSKRKKDNRDVFARYALKLPNGKRIVEYDHMDGMEADILSCNLRITSQGSKQDVEYYGKSFYGG